MVKFVLNGIDDDALLLFQEIEKQLTTKHLVLLQGELGAGKTTLVQRFLNYMSGEDVHVDSPTYSLVNTYNIKDKEVHHFDLYRLEVLEEIEDIGFMEYIDSGALCFIEWSEKIADFLPPEKVLTIDISVSLDQCREYTLS